MSNTLTLEQIAWIEEFTGLKLEPTDQVAQSATRRTAQAAAPPGGPAHAATAKPAHAAYTKHVKPEAKNGLTYDSFNFLVLQLQTLADPHFHSKPPPSLILTGEKIVAEVLRDVQQVVAKWRDAKTLPDAVRIWRSAEPRLKTFLAEAQAHLDISASQLSDARQSIEAIADFLSEQDVDQELDQAVNAEPTPELAFELDSREMKKLEPGLRAWLDAVRASGKLATPAAKKLEKRIDLYFSAPDMPKKLAAFKAAGEVPDTGALPDVIVLLSDNGAQAATTMAKTFLAVAEHAHQAGEAGAEEALDALGKWGKRVEAAAHLGRAFFGAINIALSAKTLAEGIAKGDWHKITAGAIGIAGGAVSIAEAAGAITADASSTVGTGLIVVWASIDSVLTAAEMAHWFRQKQEQDAFLALVADARKLIPMGKKMAAAVEKMMDTQADTDSFGAANNQRYQEIAEATGEKLRGEVNKLVNRHLNTSNTNTVGGYPALIGPALPIVEKGLTTMNQFKDVPMAISEGFDMIVQAIKLMTTVEAATNDA